MKLEQEEKESQVNTETGEDTNTNTETSKQEEVNTETNTAEDNNTESKQENKAEEDRENDTDKKKDIMIPKERFDEVNDKYKELKTQLDALQNAQEKKEEPKPEPKEEKKEEKQEEKQEEEKPNPEVEKLQQQVNEFKNYFDDMVSQKVETVPEEMRELIPDGLSAQQKLSWINKAEEKGLFKNQQQNVTIGQPTNRSSEQSKADKVKKLNPMQMLSSYYGEK